MAHIPSSSKIVIIGGGFSGLCTAIRLKMAGDSDFVIVERAEDLGGVWHHNRYPGAACDVPSSLYSFSFLPDYDWPKSHGAWSDIVGYMKYCVDHFAIEEHLHFGVEAHAAHWREDDRSWQVGISLGVMQARYLIAACGLFNKPQIPKFTGLDEFEGAAFHSAQWDRDFIPADKTIAVIGTGCSAAQFVPEIVEDARKLLIFQRSPCHVMPAAHRTYSAEERALFRQYPILRAAERAAIEDRMERSSQSQFDATLRDTVSQASVAGMALQISNEAKRKQLIPTYPIFGKRPILSDTFLKALDREDVEIISERIERIDATGLLTADGRHHEVDAIIFGTGFVASDYLLPLRVKGRDDRDVQAVWRDGAYAYLGMMVDGFPNFFMVYGPNSNIVGSIIQIIEPQVAFIVERISEAETAEMLVEVDTETVAQFNQELQETLKRSIYGQRVAENYFTAANGKVVTQWSGSAGDFVKAVAAASSRTHLVPR